jgi:hypothetical protein
VQMFVGNLVFNVIIIYVSQIGFNKSVKSQFLEESNALVSSVIISKKLLMRPQ